MNSHFPLRVIKTGSFYSVLPLQACNGDHYADVVGSDGPMIISDSPRHELTPPAVGDDDDDDAFQNDGSAASIDTDHEPYLIYEDDMEHERTMDVSDFLETILGGSRVFRYSQGVFRNRDGGESAVHAVCAISAFCSRPIGECISGATPGCATCNDA